LPEFTEDDQGVMWYKGRICVPDVKEFKDKILQEAHESTYFIHLGGNKMYHDLKATYWWYRMKRDVAEYVAFVALVRESRLSINDLQDYTNFASTQVEVRRNCYGFHHGIA
jgi:hypothetical protein